MPMDATTRLEVIQRIRTVKNRMCMIDKGAGQVPDSYPTAFGWNPENGKFPIILHRTSGVAVEHTRGSFFTDVSVQITKTLIGGPLGTAYRGKNEEDFDDLIMKMILIYEERPDLQDEAFNLLPLRFAVTFSGPEYGVVEAGEVNAIVFDRAANSKFFSADMLFRFKFNIQIGRVK